MGAGGDGTNIAGVFKGVKIGCSGSVQRIGEKSGSFNAFNIVMSL